MSIMYSIFKICIQNNLANTIKYKNKCFFFYIQFEYKMKNMKTE